MADVYAAQDEQLGRSVAVNLFHGASSTAHDRRRVQAEVPLLPSLHYLSLVTVFEAGVAEAADLHTYLGVELVPGPNLNQRLGRSPMAPDAVSRLGRQLAIARPPWITRVTRGLIAYSGACDDRWHSCGGVMTSPQVALDLLLGALNAHDLDAISALAPGNERFRESHRRMLTAFPDVNVEAEWTVTDAHKGVAWAHITGSHQGQWRGIGPTGRAIDVRGVIALEVYPDGRVNDFWLVNDWLGIATQIGARLAPPPT